MKICKNCGKVLDDTALYCDACGSTTGSPYGRQKKMSTGDINLLIAGIICIISLFMPYFVPLPVSLFQLSSAASYTDLLYDYMDEGMRFVVSLIRIWPYVGMLAAIGLIVAAFVKQGKKPIIYISAVLQTPIVLVLLLMFISEYRIAFGFAAYLMFVGYIYGLVACFIAERELNTQPDTYTYVPNNMQRNMINNVPERPIYPREQQTVSINASTLNRNINIEKKNTGGTIVGVSGTNNGRQFSVPTSKPIIIGRDPNIATVVVTSPEISKKHCIITYNPKFYTVRDVSTNGVYLENGERLPANADIALGSGTKLILGHTQEIFKLV